MRRDEARFTLEVRDNGKGIASATIHDPRALGLLGMRERMLPFAGSVAINANPGKGTTVVVSVPNDGARP